MEFLYLVFIGSFLLYLSSATDIVFVTQPNRVPGEIKSREVELDPPHPRRDHEH